MGSVMGFMIFNPKLEHQPNKPITNFFLFISKLLKF